MSTVATVEYAGIGVRVDDQGFLVDSDDWTPDIADAIASEAGIGPLEERHWKVITFCREDAAKEGTPPGLRRISKLSGVSMKELYQLFPTGPGKLAARVAEKSSFISYHQSLISETLRFFSKYYVKMINRRPTVDCIL